MVLMFVASVTAQGQNLLNYGGFEDGTAPGGLTPYHVGQNIDTGESFLVDDIKITAIAEVGSADFDGDGDVDLFDFAFFAGHWLNSNCHLTDWCDVTNLTGDGTVDENDLAEFVSQWMDGL